MSPLPDTLRSTEETEGKARQRQRALNVMRNPNQKQGEMDRKIDEVMSSESNEWAVSLLDHPRSHSMKREDDLAKEDAKKLELLCAWSQHRIHLFLDASIYLGSISTEDKILSVNIVARNSSLVVCTKQSDDPSTLITQKIPTHLKEGSTHLSPVVQLQSLSTHAFQIFTYCHDSLINIRNLYRTTHINCITPWIQKGKSVNRKYSTDFQSEMQMLLLTSTANEAITSVLAGNETMTENDLNKMKIELANSWTKLESLVDGMFQAFQRASIVFKEVNGCWLWKERFGAHLLEDQGKVIHGILELLSTSQQQSLSLLRRIQQEMRCWTHFYKWWKYERIRQEAIRDQVDEPKTDVSFDVLLIVDFLQRGFVNFALEETIGITLDKKTRGTYVDDDEEEEEEEEDKASGKEEEQQSKSIEEAKIYLTEPGSDGNKFDRSNEDNTRSSWHCRSSFQDYLADVEKKLRKLPDGDTNKDTNAPSADDVRLLALTQTIISGPSKGLYRRQTQSKTSVNQRHTSILNSVKKMLQDSSTLFSQAFARYASQDHHEPLKKKAHLSYPLLPFRPDALQSIARAGSPPNSSNPDDMDPHAPLQARSCYDEDKGIQWLLSVGKDEQDQHSILEVIKHDCVNDLQQITHVRCEGNIVDAGFYSTQEVVALLRLTGAEGQVTRMASFRLDLLNFSQTQSIQQIQVQRYYEMGPKEAGYGANQLSLNHFKDVTATLDSDGMLVYWDFVLLGEGQDEDEEMG